MHLLKWVDQSEKPYVIAHRGASIDAPENTIAAFNLAIEQNSDAIELDVTLCKSGEPVVIHDATVNRTTNGKGKVSDLSLSELKMLDAGSWFHKKFKGQQIPTLDEVLVLFGKQTLINIELKNINNIFDNLAEKVANTVLRNDIGDRVFFSSFNPLNIKTIQKVIPGAAIGLLTVKGLGQPGFVRLFARMLNFNAVHPHFSDASKTSVKNFHKAGLSVYPYTINDEIQIRQAISAGVDGIITDSPIQTRQTILDCINH